MRFLSLSTILAFPLFCAGQSRLALKGSDAFIPDSIAAGVQLRDTASAIAVLGRFPTEELLEDHRDMPRASFYNNDSTEVLTVYKHYGGYRNEYCELRISAPDTGFVRAALPMAHFTSGRGVKLGLSEEDIVRTFGSEAVARFGDEYVMLTYAIKDFASSPFLQRFNYPSYYAKFTFEQDRLIDYRFGFEYP
jgi:hypothetical protein